MNTNTHFLYLTQFFLDWEVFSANVVEKYVEIKCQLDAIEVFIADLITCSTCFGHHYARNMLSKQ